MKIRVYFLLLFFLPGCIKAQVKKVDAKAAVDFLLSCQKPNGAFGPIRQTYTDLAWTYPALHALRLLDATIPRETAAFVNGNQSWMEKKPWKNGPWYWSFYQKANLYELYSKSGTFEEGVEYAQEWALHYKPRERYTEFRNYPKGEFFDMSSLSHLVLAIELLDGSVMNPADVKAYILQRQTLEGGFTDDVAEEFTAVEKNAHMVITHDAVMALHALAIPVPNADAVVAWIQSCQTPSGGFKWHPHSDDHSNKPDVWYTWVAVRALDALGAAPRDAKACVQWLNSLQNADGGFGDRPGWNSRIYSTYYVVHALETLTGNAKKAITRKKVADDEKEIPENVYRIFQAHHKSPAGGKGMVDSVAAMKLNLIGVKFREMDREQGISPSVVQARRYAGAEGYPLEILAAPENYSHKLKWMSGQRADHVSNFLVPPDLSRNELQIYRRAFQSGQQGLSWEAFKEQVIAPIQGMRSGNLYYPELDYTMVNAYMVYDDGLDGKPGYNAVPGAHFGNIDWIRHFPYKERWEGILPIIADGDAHGNIVKWRPNLLQYRNVYIAEDYDFDHYVDASVNGRSVCVIHMPDGEIRYYGTEEAIDYLKKHISEWQWWNQ